MMAKINLVAEPGIQQIVITRIFDAPRQLVYKTMTDPELIPRWWGPRNLKTKIDEMDLRPGGLWRYINYDSSGNAFAFHGVYHEIRPHERLVYTFEFEGVPGHVLLETVTFEDLDGQTKLTDQSVFQSVEDRDGMLNAGMEVGASESMDRLTELLAKA
jgi:uncharacterized protein YndB with AHSA1/START domain